MFIFLRSYLKPTSAYNIGFDNRKCIPKENVFQNVLQFIHKNVMLKT